MLFLTAVAKHSTTISQRATTLGFAGWGAALYVWTGALYLIYERRLLAAARSNPAPATQ